MSIKYIEPDDLDIIIEAIKRLSYAEEPPADYANEMSSIDNYFALIERISSDYYPGIYNKASFLYISLITDHVSFFSNGNKRMATFSMLYFMNTNKYEMDDASKELQRERLEQWFPENQEFRDFEEFSGLEYFTYNLSLIIAKHNMLGIAFEDLKQRVERIFKELFNKS